MELSNKCHMIQYDALDFMYMHGLGEPEDTHEQATDE